MKLGGGDDPPSAPEDGDHRPDRNWFLIVTGAAAVVLGIRAIYIGVRVLNEERVLPFGRWFTGGW